MHRKGYVLISVDNMLLHEPARSAPVGWSTWLGTVAGELVVNGRGLHTGRHVTARILPVEAEAQRQGIVFRRVQAGRVLGELPVSPEAWRKQPLCSTLQSETGMTIRTVEHLLAALLMCEIDSATVELNAEEVPILDGGAAQWVQAITGTGRAELPGAKRFLKLLQPFAVTFSKSARYLFSPDPHYMVATSIQPDDFPTDKWRGVITPHSFASEIAPARSYGHARRAVPAILGGYLIGSPILRGAFSAPLAVIARKRVLGGMILPNEFARHRALDLVGDFAVAGAPLLARIKASKPIHERNNIVIRKLLEEKDKWAWVEFDDAGVNSV